MQSILVAGITPPQRAHANIAATLNHLECNIGHTAPIDDLLSANVNHVVRARLDSHGAVDARQLEPPPALHPSIPRPRLGIATEILRARCTGRSDSEKCENNRSALHVRCS